MSMERRDIGLRGQHRMPDRLRGQKPGPHLRQTAHQGKVAKARTGKVGLTVFNAVLVTRYLCTDCGFSEEWVDDRANVEKLRSKFQRLS